MAILVCFSFRAFHTVGLIYIFSGCPRNVASTPLINASSSKGHNEFAPNHLVPFGQQTPPAAPAIVARMYLCKHGMSLKISKSAS